MATDSQYDLLVELFAQVSQGDVVPYLGPGALEGVSNTETGEAIPADSDSLILAMNGGKAMAPKLMYEFPRAAMNLELKRGRSFVTRFLSETYGQTTWTPSELHAAISELDPTYVIDINRDTQLQDYFGGRPHVLVVGVARIGGTDFRFKTYCWVDGAYEPVDHTTLDRSETFLFKPMGTPFPEPDYIASDADYVDYLTELMGGFGMPGVLKERRLGVRYLTIGLRLTRDTERMALSDIIYGAASPGGWAVIEQPTAKERRFCESKQLEIIECPLSDVLRAAKAAKDLVPVS